MESHPKNNKLKSIIPWRVTVISGLLLLVVFVVTLIFTYYFSENTTPTLIYRQAWLTTWCQIIVFTLQTAIVSLGIVVFVSARWSLKHYQTSRSNNAVAPLIWFPSVWQWLGLLCLLLVLELIRVFVTEFMESLWGDEYWTNVFLNLPRLLSVLFAYFIWRRNNRKSVQESTS